MIVSQPSPGQPAADGGNTGQRFVERCLKRLGVS